MLLSVSTLYDRVLTVVCSYEVSRQISTRHFHRYNYMCLLAIFQYTVFKCFHTVFRAFPTSKSRLIAARRSRVSAFGPLSCLPLAAPSFSFRPVASHSPRQPKTSRAPFYFPCYTTLTRTMVGDTDRSLPTPLTIASLRAIRDRKTQMLRASPLASIPDADKTHIKPKSDDDASDVKLFIKREEDADTLTPNSMWALPKATTEESNAALFDALNQRQSIISRGEKKGTTEVQGSLAMPLTSARAYELLTPALRHEEGDNSKPVRTKLGTETATSEDIRLLHGNARLENIQAYQAVETNEARSKSLSYAQQTSTNGQIISTIDEERVKEVDVSPNKARGRLLKLSEYLKWKKTDWNEDLRKLHGLTTSSAPTVFNIFNAHPTPEFLLGENSSNQEVESHDDVAPTVEEELPMPTIGVSEVPSFQTVQQRPKITNLHPLLSSSLEEEDQERYMERMIEKVVTEKLGPMIEAMSKRKRARSASKLFSDLRSSTGESSDDSIQPIKRRKLSDTKSGTDQTSAARPLINQPAAITPSPLLPLQTTATSDDLLQLSLIRSFSHAIRIGSVTTEYTVPLSFSINVLHQGLHLPVHSIARAGAYRTIFNCLKAADLMGRNATMLMDSRKGHKWTCLFGMVDKEDCKWPKEGLPGHYACQMCMRFSRPCIIVTGGRMSVLSLAPSLRGKTTSSERTFCIKPEGVKAPKATFFY
jgi:hypothetical protein